MTTAPTHTQSWRLPAPVSFVVSRLPQLPPSAALAAALNVVAVPAFDGDALDALDGKVVRIAVRDAGLTLTVRCRRRRFAAVSDAEPADATIGACAHDFALLAARREDPDTLFFGRRLTMEGDTEVGLIVKNMLDAADLPLAAALLDRALAGAERLRALAPSAGTPSAGRRAQS